MESQLFISEGLDTECNVPRVRGRKGKVTVRTWIWTLNLWILSLVWTNHGIYTTRGLPSPCVCFSFNFTDLLSFQVLYAQRMSKGQQLTFLISLTCCHFRYFMHNACQKGRNCAFSHDRSTPPDLVCRFYLKGQCAYGDLCRWDWTQHLLYFLAHVKNVSLCNDQCTADWPAELLSGMAKKKICMMMMVLVSITCWALPTHTTFSDLDHILRSQQCQTVLTENFMFLSD